MPYWSILCVYCFGEIVDALLECLPADQKTSAAYRLLFFRQPGAALACPYCNGLIGFDNNGEPAIPQSGWPVLRYGLAELGLKKTADGEPLETSLTDWALRHRFVNPGAQYPFTSYDYAEQAPADETVP
jgi:hypothetical protein